MKTKRKGAIDPATVITALVIALGWLADQEYGFITDAAKYVTNTYEKKSDDPVEVRLVESNASASSSSSLPAIITDPREATMPRGSDGNYCLPGAECR